MRKNITFAKQTSNKNTMETIDDIETIAEKREELDNELEDYLIDLSDFQFNREDSNIYE